MYLLVFFKLEHKITTVCVKKYPLDGHKTKMTTVKITLQVEEFGYKSPLDYALII